MMKAMSNKAAFIAAAIGLLAAALLCAWAGYWLASTKATAEIATAHSTANQIIAAHQSAVAEAKTEKAKAEQAARAAEQQLQKHADEKKDEVHATEKTIHARANELAGRIRADTGRVQHAANAATAALIASQLGAVPATTSPDTSAASGHGLQFSRHFGEQLVAEAARAETIRIHYLALVERYQRAAEAINQPQP